jgi:hypothetical protein
MFEEDHAPVTQSEISESAVSCQSLDPAYHHQSIFKKSLPLERYSNSSSLSTSRFPVRRYIHMPGRFVGIRRAEARELRFDASGRFERTVSNI